MSFGTACRLGAPQLPGRSLEPCSDVRPRGMVALPLLSGRQNSAYRSSSYDFLPTGPSTSLRISAAGSDARYSPQLTGSAAIFLIRTDPQLQKVKNGSFELPF